MRKELEIENSVHAVLWHAFIDEPRRLDRFPLPTMFVLNTNSIQLYIDQLFTISLGRVTLEGCVAVMFIMLVLLFLFVPFLVHISNRF